MEYRKLRGSHRRRAEPDPFDLGAEPPLSADGGSRGIDRRQVSLRWYFGTILNGICGAALMGGAVYVALDGEAFFAATPELTEAMRTSAAARGRTSGAVRKSDRLPTLAEVNSTRHVMRVSTTVQVGEREVVRVRPFVRIATNLAMSTSELSANIPPYNPSRIIAAAAAGADSGPASEEPPPIDEADFSFVMRDLGPLISRASTTAVTPIDDVLVQVMETARGSSAAGALLASASGARLAYAHEGSSTDLYAGFESRIVPENITLLPKTASQATGGHAGSERNVVAKQGDTLSDVLREIGATDEEVTAVLAAARISPDDDALRDGQRLRILTAPAGPVRVQPVRIISMGESGPEFVVALADTGHYVAVDVHHADVQQVADDDDEEKPGTVRLYQSLYETALRQQVPQPLIEELVRIYSYDIDFQRKVQPGDSFEVLFPGEEDGEARHEVLFTSLTVGGETRRYYRFHTPDDGAVDYYDETGKSAQRFLIRKPIESGIMRSGYGMRRHPLLGYSKMHTGVDWAAPRGTPIYAAGNGTIQRIGWQGGYGQYIRIRHAFGYETAYAHMSGFARGLTVGSRVRQGQVIGYVGSTGLSTGPHLHYEVLVNNRFVDPVRIRLPRGRSLQGPLLSSFEREREKIDSMMNRAPTQLSEEASRAPRREAARR